MYSSSSSLYFLFNLLIIILALLETVNSQATDWLCESLICDPPKKCLIVDEVAQCLVDPSPSVQTPAPFGTINGGQPFIPNFLAATTTPPPTLIPEATVATTTTPSPFAPFLNFFNGGGGGAAPTIPTLPPFTLPTPPPTTTPEPVDICSLPPVTGTCNRARIMWYYDTESRRCERFSWSGCGNENRFSSRMQCEQTCSQTSLFRRNP